MSYEHSEKSIDSYVMTMTRTEYDRVRVVPDAAVIESAGSAAMQHTVVNNANWRTRGMCHDESGQIVNVFLGNPDKKLNNEMNDEAKEICNTCPVKDPCGEYGLDNPGIKAVLGGMTYTERTRIRKARTQTP